MVGKFDGQCSFRKAVEIFTDDDVLVVISILALISITLVASTLAVGAAIGLDKIMRGWADF
ncbi:MAG: hypothetical protein GY799_25415 [Desulfobulbaceae bacterium]|nr:hypothetical protein [Desulfobulbaceae bacterium]